MADPKKIANNILDFLIDPTKIPVKQRVYFRPEENLKNDVYENAKADAAKAYKNQRSNSDFYPNKNRQITQREATLMDRKSLIASFDILSKNFSENDPIGKDLRTMAAAVSKMSDEEFSSRQASDAPNFEGMQVEAKGKAATFPCPTCGTKVLEAAGFCVKCKKKVKPGKKAADEEPAKEEPKDEEPAKEEPKDEEPAKKEPEEKKEEDVEASDFWTKEAMTRVAQALVSDILGIMSQEDEEAPVEPDKKEDEVKKAPKEEEVEVKKAPKVEEVEAKKTPKEEVEAKKAPKEEEVEAKKTPKEEVEDENKKAAVVPEEEKVVEKKLPVKEEKKSTVNTDILATITFGDITMDAPIVDAGEMTEEEKARLAGLFN